MGEVIDLGFSFKPVPRSEFDERLRVIRVGHAKRLQQGRVVRDGRLIGTVYTVQEGKDQDPVAFYGADGTYYIRCT